MTTITREHLELAAKAAGKKLIEGRLVPPGSDPAMNLFSYPIWMPHLDSADAWQLAADCKLCIAFDDQWVLASRYEHANTFGGTTGRTAMEAVTLAASELGRAMG